MKLFYYLYASLLAPTVPLFHFVLCQDKDLQYLFVYNPYLSLHDEVIVRREYFFSTVDYCSPKGLYSLLSYIYDGVKFPHCYYLK